MPVQAIFVVLAAIAALGLLRLAWLWRTYRGNRVITCPENHLPAGVRVDARHAVATALLKGPELRLSTCSRWPERQGCGQQCLRQVADSPADCLVRNILVNWYKDKVCTSCGQPFGDIEWSRKPALLAPESMSLEWNQVPAEKLFQVLSVSEPLCFACHMAKTLVREHPELVVDRSTSPK